MRIGVDIGGTFTDFVTYHPQSGEIETFKLLSTPHDPAEAVLAGLKQIADRAGAGSLAGWGVVHGSTVATNALLERRGARSAFVATRGFADILQIGRQNRPELYDLFANPPPPLAPPELCFEVGERVDHQGAVLQALDPSEADALTAALLALGVESAAVCLLFSFLHPQHEQVIGERLRQAGLFVSLSSEVLPEFREYERASTTAVNAYVSPVLDRYLAHLEGALGGNGQDVRLRVMQSNGGSLSLGEARRSGVHCILSGPAGGVVGAQAVAQQAAQASASAHLRLITFDMGGTSTDVSLIDGSPQVTSDAVIGGCPIHIPLLDVHTIGAGGGSIAALDAGGALRVGPQSAGADPGPACYGRGELPTVTDANLVLGRLIPERFLGGQMRLQAERAWDALRGLGAAADLSAEQAALGVVEVVNAHMERALRVISVERGHDPADFTLLSFGGAGGLHAADLARRLGIRRLLVPPLASTLSAFGMLAADVVKDYSQTVMMPGDTALEEITQRLAHLEQRGRDALLVEGIPSEAIVLQPQVDLRYRGQSYELSVAFGPGYLAEFHRLHQFTYGYSAPEAPVELVNLRLRAVGRVSPPRLAVGRAGGPDPAAAACGQRRVSFDVGALEVACYLGERLSAGNHIDGPALVVRPDTTILLGPADTADVDQLGNLVVLVGAVSVSPEFAGIA